MQLQEIISDPPAANNDFEVEFTVDQGYFRAQDYQRYNFYLSNRFDFYDDIRQGKTDAEGKANLKFQIPKNFTNNGLLNGRIYATVFDETGRPVHRSKNFKIYSQDVFIGIGNFDYWVGTRQPIDIPLVALNKDEKEVTQQAQLEIIQYQWHSVLRNTNGRYRYVSEREEITLKKENINISGKQTKYYFTPPESGSYMVRITLPEANTYVERRFYAYNYGDSHSTSFEVNNEGNIDIEFDKESYRPGEKANAILKLPFDGKVLITTERDEVMSFIYVNSKDKVIKHPIAVNDRNVPNTYVTATLIKPHGQSSLPLTVAHGFASFKVEPNGGELKLDITAVEKSRSRTKQQITIQSAPNTNLTVAVVDEGILALKNQKTPDPHNHFYAKRALSVEAYDLYPFLFPEVTATGGDESMMDDMAKRQNPMKNKRVKLVSFWSDIIQTNSSGKATFEVDIPQFSGSLRVMAVGTKDKQFGSSEKNITVADPIVLSSGIPRVLKHGRPMVYECECEQYNK